jgi:chromosome segregation ATPase
VTVIDVDDFLGYILDDTPASELSHAYDPVKAREYYLKTRQLKGRLKGSPKPVGRALTAAENVVEAKRSRVRRIAAQKAKRAKLKKLAEERVDKLQTRLDRLDEVLKELTKQAKARSGVKTKSTASTNSTSKSNGSSKPKTASQKRDDAKRAKEQREKDGDPSLSDQAKELEAKIAKVRESITKMKEQIAEARKKAQTKKPDAKKNTKTASNGRSKTEERR